MYREVDCLVTGATGFLGRSLTAGLLKSGASIRCLVRESSSALEFPALGDMAGGAAKTQILRGNLLSPTDVARAVDGVRVVYHLAAEMRGLPATIFPGTVVGSRNLLRRILQARPQRVVLISSLNVYGLATVHPKNVITEDFALDEHPEKRDVYTHAKLWQERLFHEYLTDSGIELTIVRPGYIYGPDHKDLPPRLGLTLGAFLLSPCPGKSLPMTYVDNCTDAVIFCGSQRQAAGEAYNIVDDDLPTGREYLERYPRVAGRPRAVRAPYVLFSALSHMNHLGNRLSAGQIPVVLTHYKAACAWRGHQFSSEKLKRLGWRQPISTEEALGLAFPLPTSPGPSNRSVPVPLRNTT
jgi:nucleoside-diphosphate-sugar epimerase